MICNQVCHLRIRFAAYARGTSLTLVSPPSTGKVKATFSTVRLSPSTSFASFCCFHSLAIDTLKVFNHLEGKFVCFYFLTSIHGYLFTIHSLAQGIPKSAFMASTCFAGVVIGNSAHAKSFFFCWLHPDEQSPTVVDRKILQH